MTTATKRPKHEFHSIQLWPRGETVEYAGSYPHYVIKNRLVRDATQEENDSIQANVLAAGYVNHKILACQSSLVDELIRSDHEGFQCDDIENMTLDPSDWDVAKCRQYLIDGGGDEHTDNNPWIMDKQQLIEFLSDEGVFDGTDEVESTEYAGKTVEQLLAIAIEAIDDETASGIETWREVTREYSQDNPQEAYEWWLVSSWLCGKLREHGEIVIDNNYGFWWGRGCTGQSMIMDGILQRIAASIL